MYIQPNSSYNIASTGKPPKKPTRWDKIKNSVIQKLIDVTPSATFKVDKKLLDRLNKIDEIASRPAENRLIMGATAIVTQPAIDYCNKKVDEDTRTVSRNRTIAKIIAGTTVGILVRGSSYSLVEKMTDFNKNGKLSKLLLPKDKKLLNELKKEPKFLKTYRSALSTAMAIAAMCFTNFAFDAPFTVYLTNKFNEKSKNKKAKKLAKEVNNG